MPTVPGSILPPNQASETHWSYFDDRKSSTEMVYEVNSLLPLGVRNQTHPSFHQTGPIWGGSALLCLVLIGKSFSTHSLGALGQILCEKYVFYLPGCKVTGKKKTQNFIILSVSMQNGFDNQALTLLYGKRGERIDWCIFRPRCLKVIISKSDACEAKVKLQTEPHSMILLKDTSAGGHCRQHWGKWAETNLWQMKDPPPKKEMLLVCVVKNVSLSVTNTWLQHLNPMHVWFLAVLFNTSQHFLKNLLTLMLGNTFTCLD